MARLTCSECRWRLNRRPGAWCRLPVCTLSHCWMAGTRITISLPLSTPLHQVVPLRASSFRFCEHNSTVALGLTGLLSLPLSLFKVHRTGYNNPTGKCNHYYYYSSLNSQDFTNEASVKLSWWEYRLFRSGWTSNRTSVV